MKTFFTTAQKSILTFSISTDGLQLYCAFGKSLIYCFVKLLKTDFQNGENCAPFNVEFGDRKESDKLKEYAIYS